MPHCRLLPAGLLPAPRSCGGTALPPARPRPRAGVHPAAQYCGHPLPRWGRAATEQPSPEAILRPSNRWLPGEGRGRRGREAAGRREREDRARERRRDERDREPETERRMGVGGQLGRPARLLFGPGKKVGLKWPGEQPSCAGRRTDFVFNLQTRRGSAAQSHGRKF